MENPKNKWKKIGLIGGLRNSQTNWPITARITDNEGINLRYALNVKQCLAFIY